MRPSRMSRDLPSGWTATHIEEARYRIMTVRVLAVMTAISTASTALALADDDRKPRNKPGGRTPVLPPPTSPKARVIVQRGSSHALSRFRVSPLPAPSTPAKTMITGNAAASRRARCTVGKSARSTGSRAL